ncbi:MAG TPA: multiheme c-type cytochrome [Armatimonadota bacterium]|jgi:hypothetical protein
MSRVRTATFLKWQTLVLATGVVSLTALLLGGCGGGGTTVTAPPSGFIQTGATYVGSTTCQECHGNTYAQFTGAAPFAAGETNAHGQIFTAVHGKTPAHGRELTYGSGASCAACHTTGFGEASGFKADGSTPNLEGIGCEVCHGPGSKHAAAFGDVTQITKNVQAKYTCWNCHLSGFKLLNNGAPPAVNDDTLLAKAPNDGHIAPGHPQTLSLLGYQGFNLPQTPSPHATLSNTCLDCHFSSSNLNPSNGKVDHTNANLEPNTDRTRAECAACHSGRADTALQLGITKELITLGGEDPANPGKAHPSGGGTDGVDPATGELGLLPQYVKDNAASFTNPGTGLVDLSYKGNSADPIVKAYKAARYNYMYVVGDKSLGVHNPELSSKLLADAKTYLANKSSAAQ